MTGAFYDVVVNPQVGQAQASCMNCETVIGASCALRLLAGMLNHLRREHLSEYGRTSIDDLATLLRKAREGIDK